MAAHGSFSPPAAASADWALDTALAAATQTVLNCYLREGGRLRRTSDVRVASLPLPDGRGELLATVRHFSPTGWHRFTGPVRLRVPGEPPRDVSFPTLACLLIDALAHDDPRGPGAPTLLLERMLESVHAVAGHLGARRDDLERLWSADPLTFADTEQALLLGHPLHPTPKSRGEMSPAERRAYSPERGARFRLHWLAVTPELVAHDSATGTPAPVLAQRLLREDPGLDRDALAAQLRPLGPRVLLPAHPWEAAHLRLQAAAVYEAGHVVDLGPQGTPVAPTTSVRTVYREDWDWQLKFSLHVRVTNSMRVTLPKELDRAVEAARLAQTSAGAELARIAPRLRVVHDAAYLTVRHEGQTIDGFSVLLRENRWPGSRSADVSALTVLCQDDPRGGRSRLGRIVERIAVESGRTQADVAREWFARYLDAVIVSLVRLYLELGLCFEPHQQNVLLELDGGWPARAVLRDSQGYFHREAAHADMCEIVPGLGEASESVFPEALADERLVYYPFLNNALGVVGALGAAGCIDEPVLLGDLRRTLEAERARGGRYPATLLDRLLDDAEWPCKANLRTRLHDMDELVGDIATQSVYVTIPNPLA